MGLVIQCDSMEDMAELIFAISIVALSDTEGNLIDGDPSQCEIKKLWLKRRMATGSIETLQNFEESSFSSQKIDYMPVNRTHEKTRQKNSFQGWVENIVARATAVSRDPYQEGDRGNQQVVPEFVKDFLNLAGTIPLWTAILTKYFPFCRKIASSASVESNFNNLKNRIFQNVTLPLRADNFLAHHIPSIEGQMKIVASVCTKEVRQH